jgi:hypothetical protein
MTLSTFCDIVWAEIWDDCSPMGDQAKYRDIVYRLFIKGDDPATITYKDSKGKTRRLTDRSPDITAPTPKDKLEAARALYEQVRQAQEASRVASDPDG